jgi:hypothetical protein
MTDSQKPSPTQEEMIKELPVGEKIVSKLDLGVAAIRDGIVKVRQSISRALTPDIIKNIFGTMSGSLQYCRPVTHHEYAVGRLRNRHGRFTSPSED